MIQDFIEIQMSVVPSTTPSRQDQSMLAFKLGERLGALNKNDEVTRGKLCDILLFLDVYSLQTTPRFLCFRLHSQCTGEGGVCC